MLAASRRAERVARTAMASTIAIGLAAVAVGIGFSLLLTRRLVRPIRQIMGATEALAEGDYDVRVPPSDTDEFERLGAGFNAMAGKLGAYHRLNVERIVAETRKSEAVLRSIDDGIVVVDAGFTITDMNPTAGRMLGVEPDWCEGKHFLEVIKNQRLFDHVKATAESGAPPDVEEGTSILTVGDGEGARHYMFAVTPVVSKDGAMLGVVVVLRDVTRLKELDRLKSEFLMTASHDAEDAAPEPRHEHRPPPGGSARQAHGQGAAAPGRRPRGGAAARVARHGSSGPVEDRGRPGRDGPGACARSPARGAGEHRLPGAG